MDPQFVKASGDFELILHGEGDPCSLYAIAKSSIIKLNIQLRHRLPLSP